MCGILAVVIKDRSLTPLLNEARLVAERFISLRGPDFQKQWLGKNYFLYQSTLSITGAVQKKISEAKVAATPDFLFNGEIYDVGPELEAQFLSDLSPIQFHKKNPDGMYSLIWPEFDEDGVLTSLHACADPQGEKRLHFFEDERVMVISSVPGAIVPFIASKKIDEESLALYLGSRHFNPGKKNLLRGLQQITSGDLWQFSSVAGKNAKVIRSFNFNCFFEANLHQDKTYFESHVERLFEIETERFCKHGKQIKSGAIFSGGVDSSLQGCFLLDQKPQMELFCLDFNGKDNSSGEASKLAKLIGSSSTLHVELLNLGLYSKLALRCYELCAGVIPTHSMPSTMALGMFASKRNVRVLYGGEGADELFLGYPCYLKILEGKQKISDYSFVSQELWNISGFRKVWDKWSNFASNQNLYSSLSDQELNVKVSSLIDYFVQCRGVGFFSTDIGISDYGVEARSIFGRHKVIKAALSCHPRVLLNDNQPKSVLTSIYKKKFKRPPVKKVGFAGYPNDLANYFIMGELTAAEKELFNIAKLGLSKRDFDWKLINYRIFKQNFNIS